MPKIKVLMLINNLGTAGAENLLLSIARNIDRDRFEMSVCYIEDDDSLAKDFERLGVEVIGLRTKRKPDIKALSGLYRVFRERDIDILHTHLPYAGSLGRVVGRLAGVPKIISTQHNVAGAFHKATLIADKLTLPLTDVVTAVSEPVEESFFGKSHPFSLDLLEKGIKTFTIYNGVDLSLIDRAIERTNPGKKREELGLGIDDPVVGIVARFVAWKGHRDLIKAMAIVVNQWPEAKLLIVGWGVLENELRGLVSGLHLQGNVIFAGRRKDVYELLPIMDLFVLPYRYEGLFKGGGVGIAIMEAMAAGRPVITTNVPGISSAVFNGQTGIVVPQGNPAALAEAILELLGNPQKARRLGEAGRRLIEENFTIQRTVAQYEALYEALASQ